MLGITVEHDGIHLQEAGPEPVAQGADARVVGRHVLARQPEGFAHADDLVRGQRARAHAALVAATVHLGVNAHARLAPNVKRANSLGPVNFVRRQRHQVDRQLLQVDHHLAGGLRGIHMEQHAPGTAQRAECGHVLHHTGFIVDEHHRGQHGVGAQGRLKHRQVKQTAWQHRQHGYLAALALKLAHAVQHRLVLGGHCHQVLASGAVKVGGAFDGEVI